MGTIGYRRTLRVQLFETCDHVRLAKAFRAWTRSVEGLVTLEEKAVRSEKVQQLIGSAVAQYAAGAVPLRAGLLLLQ